MPNAPTVSVIISAYNRPKVIPYAIQSVLNSDYDDWEMIVVGDGCNAATEDAIRAFPDKRIRFHNLPENTGHQSAPHNAGVDMARGKYVFFLNQDDMYFPHHIAARVAFMEETGADISWSPILLLQQSGSDSGPVDPGADKLILDGAVADGKFDPRTFVISSCWAVRRDICHKVGPWLPIEQTRLSPSQEWLHRAHAQGRSMAFHRHVSVLCIHSGVRRYSYVIPESPEHARAWAWICDGPQARIDLLNCAAIHMAGDLFETQNALKEHRRPLLAMAQRVGRSFGLHPDAVQRFFDGLKAGGWVDNHTRFTKSAPPVLAPDQTVHFGAGDADTLVGPGWHKGEPSGRWSSQERADIVFRTTQDNLTLELSGHSLRRDDRIGFLVNGKPVLTAAFQDATQPLSVPIAEAGLCVLTIVVRNPTSPHALGRGDDSRVLGLHLSKVKLVVPPPAALD
ncbi:glycosyltransferase family 2 protein [Maliponia aquimaris]|uniref:Putative teichuronic acid biosynthesis glycosyltransferase TuaG n=1 Tax=Maliponia aquimaris TaxID=1673631 RepID=A0A238K704_9RHOB|nr:glycosyltransferase family 2 protein [Maliponia aquimaris]SMX38595.1 Putative teichuronic acid biosynthesis glycosyltransferase TuaG [Maliponia aquimaris]